MGLGREFSHKETMTTKEARRSNIDHHFTIFGRMHRGGEKRPSPQPSPIRLRSEASARQVGSPSRRDRWDRERDLPVFQEGDDWGLAGARPSDERMWCWTCGSAYRANLATPTILRFAGPHPTPLPAGGRGSAAFRAAGRGRYWDSRRRYAMAARRERRPVRR
jgi:hypothetical protein